MAYDFVAPTTSKLKVRVDYGTSKKIITIKGFKPDGTAAEAMTVLDAVLFEIGGVSYDVKSIKKISVWDVESDEWVEVVFIPADIAPIFDGTYTPSGTVFTNADILPIFNGTYVPSGNRFSADDFKGV